MPGIGDNYFEASDQSLFFHHFREIRAARGAVDAAKAIEKDLRKKAKVDGIILADIDYGLRIVTAKDDSIIIDEAVRHIRIQRWLGLPIGAEPELDFEREPIFERAAREGAAAGRLAADRTSPYGPASEENQIWLANYDDAQRQVADGWLAEQQRRQAERAAAAAKLRSEGSAEGEVDADYGDEDEDETAAA